MPVVELLEELVNVESHRLYPILAPRGGRIAAPSCHFFGFFGFGIGGIGRIFAVFIRASFRRMRTATGTQPVRTAPP
jgi:hypothetical protein